MDTDLKVEQFNLDTLSKQVYLDNLQHFMWPTCITGKIKYC